MLASPDGGYYDVHVLLVLLGVNVRMKAFYVSQSLFKDCHCWSVMSSDLIAMTHDSRNDPFL